MDPFTPTPPDWTKSAIHALSFQCPRCGNGPLQAQQVWINRQAPVYSQDYHKKWQEFYHCSCDAVWWAWSSDRPAPDWLQDKDPV